MHSLTATAITAIVKRLVCLLDVICVIQIVDTDLFKFGHSDYLSFPVPLQPSTPMAVMAMPTRAQIIACVRLIALISVLPAAPMMIKSPIATIHSKNVFIIYNPFYH